ncbi:hypothetical protein [Legionella septentrionalis]|uniref:hypothetical protein n=1 Tax=Legionella septentrionalis TaxID=2498109 RepID=UPI000F8F794F|nr:hypothetical protein [Legionella septentrionalis]RUQ99576.1 hypothetical protein ELY11_04440 [Legionella septentrionalis]
MGLVLQDLLIWRVNRHFRKNNQAELQFDTGGVCNGLASVFVKYHILDKDKEFENILNRIAWGQFTPKNTDGEPWSNINYFATQVLLAYQPIEYVSGVAQQRSTALLKINGQPLDPSFNLTLSTGDKNWAEIFKSINLQSEDRTEKEGMIVSSANHSIAITREKDGSYKIYDPNYFFGFKVFKNEEAVIRELHYNVFEYRPFGNMGLNVRIIRHPEAVQPRAFPGAADLYETYYKPDNRKAYSGFPTYSSKFDTMALALRAVHDEIAFGVLLEKTKSQQKNKEFQQEELENWIVEAGQYNNVPALKKLLKEFTVTDAETIARIFAQVCVAGPVDSFKMLYEHYQDKLEDLPVFKFVQAAIISENPELVKETLCTAESHKGCSHDEYLALSDKSSAEKYKIFFATLERILLDAVKQGSVACVQQVMEKFKEYQEELTDEVKIVCLKKAIENNHADVVDELIHVSPKISPLLLQGFIITPRAAQQMDVSILRTLQAGGMIFSAEVADVYKQKSGEKTFLGIGTLIKLLLNFLQEKLSKSQQISFINYKKNALQEVGQLEEQLNEIEDAQFKKSMLLKLYDFKANMDAESKENICIKLQEYKEEIGEKLIPIASLEDFLDDISNDETVVGEQVLPQDTEEEKNVSHNDAKVNSRDRFFSYKQEMQKHKDPSEAEDNLHTNYKPGD